MGQFAARHQFGFVWPKKQAKLGAGDGSFLGCQPVKQAAHITALDLQRPACPFSAWRAKQIDIKTLEVSAGQRTPVIGYPNTLFPK
jgi:hypothetical protein